MLNIKPFKQFDKKISKLKKIQTTTLEEIAHSYNLTKINAIKIDIEGAEYDVFANIDSFLEKYNPEKIIMELHPNSKRIIDIDYFKNILKSHNYTVQIIEITDNGQYPMLFAKL